VFRRNGRNPKSLSPPSINSILVWNCEGISGMQKTFAAFSIVLALGGLSFAPPADAEVRILSSPGGQVGTFLDLFEGIRQTGERVVIDGPCYSACTLVLAAVPNDHICVTRRAVLGFHGARSVDKRGRFHAEPEASSAVLDAYPEPVRAWIRKHGGLNSRLLLLRGRALTQMYPRCV
jgi:hypothetical protein